MMNDKKTFQKLKDKWQKETGFMSDLGEIYENESYLQIIGMGQDALPFIVESMEEEYSHWFLALRAITRENPVPIEHQGNIKLMTKDWLEYLKTQEK